MKNGAWVIGVGGQQWSIQGYKDKGVSPELLHKVEFILITGFVFVLPVLQPARNMRPSTYVQLFGNPLQGRHRFRPQALGDSNLACITFSPIRQFCRRPTECVQIFEEQAACSFFGRLGARPGMMAFSGASVGTGQQVRIVLPQTGAGRAHVREKLTGTALVQIPHCRREHHDVAGGLEIE